MHMKSTKPKPISPGSVVSTRNITTQEKSVKLILHTMPFKEKLSEKKSDLRKNNLHNLNNLS